MILAGIAEAVSAGATRGQACAGVGLNARTVARWGKNPDGCDLRAGPKTTPAHTLSEAERTRIVETPRALEAQLQQHSVRQRRPHHRARRASGR